MTEEIKEKSDDERIDHSSTDDESGEEYDRRKMFLVRKKIRGLSCRQSLARCILPPRFRTTRLLMLIFINAIWLIILWAGVAAKAFSDSSYDYVRHYTNWMWTIGTIYYTLDFIGLLMESRTMEMIILLIPWWIVFSNINIVFWLTFVMVYDNPGTITDNFEENGGDLYAGTVLLGDKIFHILPLVMAYFNLFLRIPDFIEIYDGLFGSNYKGEDTERIKNIIYKELKETDHQIYESDRNTIKRFSGLSAKEEIELLDEHEKKFLLEKNTKRKKWINENVNLTVGRSFLVPSDHRSVFYFGCVPDNSIREHILHIYIAITFFFSFSIFFIYYNIFDFNEVYEVDTPIWVGLLIVIGAVGLNTVPFLMITSPIGEPIREKFMASWSISVNDPSIEDYYLYNSMI